MSILTDIIGSDGFAYPGVVTYTRRSPGSTDGFGRYIPGAATTATLSPVGIIPGSSVLEANAEGWSAENTLTLYTTVKLIKLPFPDQISVDGELYLVHSVEGPWTGFDGIHYVVHAARLATPGTD